MQEEASSESSVDEPSASHDADPTTPFEEAKDAKEPDDATVEHAPTPSSADDEPAGDAGSAVDTPADTGQGGEPPAPAEGAAAGDKPVAEEGLRSPPAAGPAGGRSAEKESKGDGNGSGGGRWGSAFSVVRRGVRNAHTFLRTRAKSNRFLAGVVGAWRFVEERVVR